MKRISLCLALILASSAAIANQSENYSSTTYNRETLLPENWKPFLAFSSGYMGQGDRVDVEGTPFNLKGLASYYAPNGAWLADLGFGFQVQDMYRGADPIVPVIEGSARVNLGNDWSLGPIMNTYLAEPSRYGSANTNVTSFLGLAAAKEFMFQDYQMRAGITGMTDMDIPGQQVNTLQLNIHVGLGDGAVAQSTAVAPVATPATISDTAAYMKRASGDLAWDRSLAQFALNESKLTPSGKSYLIRVADVIKSNLENIDTITIVGHTDPTGTEQFNKRLSVERARTVAAFLRTRGIPASKMQIQGVAATQPRFNEDYLNRRAELKMSGVNDLTAVEQQLISVQ